MSKKIIEYLKDNKFFILLLILTIGLFGTFFMTNIDGSSMNDTLQDGDQVLCVRFVKPKKGDIIICDTDDGKRLVKRVIATSGDTISIKNGAVILNDEVLNEPYIKESMQYIPENSFEYPLTIPEGRYFVMGDNRNHLTDSRDTRCGLISKNKIVGKVVLYPKRK